MAPRIEHLKTELIERVAKIVQSKLQDLEATAADHFVRLFYRDVPPVDIAQQSPETLYGAALSFWQFAQTRPAKQPRMRVFNPRQESHGWKSNHTVIEVVNDDMPFLVDSVTAALNGLGLTVHLVIHPTMPVSRDEDGRLRLGEIAGQGEKESFMHFEVDEQTDPDVLTHLESTITQVLADVRLAVEDWQPMLNVTRGLRARLQEQPPQTSPEELSEANAFLEWILDNNFTLLGYREYDYGGRGATRKLVIADGGLGLLRDQERQVFENWLTNKPLPPELQALAQSPALLWISKSNAKSPVHRPVHMDVIGVKKYGEKGRVVGEQLVLGLFTSTAYSLNPRNIPLLRRKLENAKQRSRFAPASHDYKALAHILENYPRDELLQIDEEQLLTHAVGILHLQERQRIALFVRRDPFERFVSALVYVPRERYNTELRRRFVAILERAFSGKVVAFTPQMSPESVLAQVLFILKTTPGSIPQYDIDDIEAALQESARSWTDKLRDALIEAKGEEAGLRLDRLYGTAFSQGYRERYTPGTAVFDIDMIEQAINTGELGMHLHRPIEGHENDLRLKLYHTGDPLPLSDVLPTLENMGLKVISEEPFEVRTTNNDETIWIHDFEALTRVGAVPDVSAVRTEFQTALARVVKGEAEDDGFNKLVLGAGLVWREVVILRAACKFLLQARIPFSQAYMERTLVANPELARLIVRLFAVRFAPDASEQRVADLRTDIATALDSVANLDQDRILRRFANFVDSTLRTNFYQTDKDGQPKGYVSFKIDSRSIEELPEPRPMVEISVYSPRMEGCHLRGGKVARGGIRWSDRREDFRTEILGLVKAQMVKNAVIVPVGSKGGFVCKRLPEVPDRQALMDEVVHCYKTLMCGMLDLTDNLAGGDVVPPVDVVRHDGDDPYLVVAADKGTATFSDIANEISKAYGFWLGDAFASGGSAGYDHKAMGITARGAWESVKRHFRELGRDIQSEPFTAIGVGDMSGDVFGNGMLLSEQTQLLAAFNHLHVFVDPTPDLAQGFAERKRLFEMPRSSWTDYNANLISQGGGVFDRRAKSVSISPEMKALFGIEEETLTPNELVRAVLKADVDLLWFGGIGTYVKSSLETQADADDRANDAVRVNANELRASVIGEGANLGTTQRGRVEFARLGGFTNTDFIDNSAGVDASDHEVNIKIVLDDVVADGDMTEKQRNQLLSDMTDQVARLVLNDNYLQSQAISLATTQASDLLDQQWRMMRTLERSGRLDRTIEFLPDDEEIAERKAARVGLTRPEYAVLFSYAKLSLYDEILPTDLPDDPYLVRDLARYFPEQLQERFPEQLARHRLRREIVATYITNSLVNRVGATFVHALQAQTGRRVADIARAYIVARDAFRLRPEWRAIEALDSRVAAKVQAEMALELERLVERSTVWFLRNSASPFDIAVMVERFSKGIGELAEGIAEIVTPHERDTIAQRVRKLVAADVPPGLAEKIGALDVMASACDIVGAAEAGGVPVRDAGRVYFEIGARLGIDWLRQTAQHVKVESNWQQLAVNAIVDDTYGHQVSMTSDVLDIAGSGALTKEAAVEMIDTWISGRVSAVERTNGLLEELRSATEIDLAMLTVANRDLRALVVGT